MSVELIEVCGVNLDVYYDYSVEHDPYGTGDSPTAYVIQINSIEVGGDTQNVIDIMPNFVLEKIEQKLIQIEKG